MTLTRRTVLAAAAATAGVSALTITGTGAAAVGRDTTWGKGKSANGWTIDPDKISTHQVEGSAASVDLRDGDAAVVLLHVARRWHYEIAPLDTGQGGGISGHTTSRTIAAGFESNYLSGTALTVHPTAYPLDGSEGLWPHQELIVRDILLDCEGAVVWGGDLTPVKYSHFHIAAKPGSKTLASLAERLSRQPSVMEKARGAGEVEDPAHPSRRVKAKRLERAQNK
ncbi:hypothetical protein ACX6XY_14660 [Streptomyces sp. O3]